MKIVPLEFPADLAQAVQRNNDHVPKEAAKLLALELFRQGKVSISRAAELCETPLAVFMEFAAAHGGPAR